MKNNAYINKKVSLSYCSGYSPDKIYSIVRTLYKECGGKPLKGKRILIKPNILSDHRPERAVTTHPAVVEAVIRFAQNEGAAKIMVGDSPAMHGKNFRPEKCGIYEVCLRTGAEWVCFGQEYSERTIGKQKVYIADAVNGCDILISLPKLKTHGFMLMTGAVKNTFGLIPQLHKAKQHAVHNNTKTFASFLLDLNEYITPDFILMDAITAMEGEGPSNGRPKQLNTLLASTNPLAIDIAAATLIGYPPLDIPTNREGLNRGKWLEQTEDIEYLGEKIEKLRPEQFRLINGTSGISRIILHYLTKHIPFARRLQPRPVFNSQRCIGCRACIRICPRQILTLRKNGRNHIEIKASQCIRCFCCQEVCPENAIDIRRRFY